MRVFLFKASLFCKAYSHLRFPFLQKSHWAAISFYLTLVFLIAFIIFAILEGESITCFFLWIVFSKVFRVFFSIYLY